jgi:hypothetical protein
MVYSQIGLTMRGSEKGGGLPQYKGSDRARQQLTYLAPAVSRDLVWQTKAKERKWASRIFGVRRLVAAFDSGPESPIQIRELVAG